MKLFAPRESETTLSKSLRWGFLILTVFFVLAALLASASFAYTYKYRQQIYPGVRLIGLNFGGLTKTQATDAFNTKISALYHDGYFFAYDQRLKTITDANQDILHFNLQSQIDRAFNAGRSTNWLKNLLEPWAILIFKKTLPLDYQLNKDLLKEQLIAAFADLENPGREAGMEINIIDPAAKTFDLTFIAPKAGQTFNYFGAIEQFEINVQQLTNTTVTLFQQSSTPKITLEQARMLEPAVRQALDNDGFSLFFEDRVWPISWTEYTRWITLGLDKNEQPAVIINSEIAGDRLSDIAEEINQPPINAKFTITNGRATEFKPSQDGRDLDLEKTLAKIQQMILQDRGASAELMVKVVEPAVKTSSINDLGINEKLGTGFSDFSGSPANRRHNIGVGAAALNGVLIPPGEEFSLINTLGTIDAANGYLPELVIKENKTTPEYGGGLCQIGTTIFRAALQSGLPIVERRNHSYRVVYYEPAGTDATIYDPKPDFIFKNDTATYVLIQTKMIGNQLFFEIWGTADGRTIKFFGNNETSNLRELKPVIYNITVPGEPKMIETTELAPGEKKKQETAHNGADAYFKRTVIYPDQTETTETFSSHYVPWRAVYLVGIDPTKPVEPVPETPANETTPPTDTPAPIDTNPLP